jgi:hypothetical protein
MWSPVVTDRVVHVPMPRTVLWDALLPYRCKPRLHGHIVSILGLGVSSGVHNIAFSVSRNGFRTVQLVFLLYKALFLLREALSFSWNILPNS